MKLYERVMLVLAAASAGVLILNHPASAQLLDIFWWAFRR